MPVLTLTPSRFASADSFNLGAYVYIVADRPVRRLGKLVTAAPISLQKNEVDEILSAELIPNSQVDEGAEFLYTLSVFDEDGTGLYSANIVMPDADVNVFDLIPVPQDLNACEPATLQDNS